MKNGNTAQTNNRQEATMASTDEQTRRQTDAESVYLSATEISTAANDMRDFARAIEDGNYAAREAVARTKRQLQDALKALEIAEEWQR